MKSTDLRIGNKFQFPVNGKTEYWDIISISKDEVYFSQNEDYNHFLNLQPIPLTEEILLKLDKNNEFLMIDKVGFIIFKNGYAYQFIFADYPCLHQLQNLYYALTGKELNVKL